MALHENDLATARQILEEALVFAMRLNTPLLPLSALERMAGLLLAEGRPDAAARLLGATETLRASVDLTPNDPSEIARTVEDARAALGAARYERELAAGRTLTIDEAAELSLRAPDSRDEISTRVPLDGTENDAR